MNKENLSNVRNNIEKAITRVSRNPEDVLLIAVSKTRPIDDLLDAYNEGVRDFGENKVQELLKKYEEMPSDCKFHMIGHLQTNKVKSIIGKTCLIHSVDSYKLAKVINDESEKAGIITDILVEINIGDEDTKYGIKKEEALEFIKSISGFKNIAVKGLMAIAPYVVNPEDNRQHFVALKRLGIDINNQNIDNISIGVYSMGMTGDYEVAIEEGATMVRVGTGIFGERDYSNI